MIKSGQPPRTRRDWLAIGMAAGTLAVVAAATAATLLAPPATPRGRLKTRSELRAAVVGMTRGEISAAWGSPRKVYAVGDTEYRVYGSLCYDPSTGEPDDEVFFAFRGSDRVQSLSFTTAGTEPNPWWVRSR